MKAQHRVGPPVVRLNRDRAVASLPAIIDIPTVIRGVEAQLSSHARLLYRLERRNGAWRICFLDATYARDELTASMPGQSLTVLAQDVAQYRKSYRFLCYVLGLTSYVPSQDLAGEDLPETVAALMAEVYGWAGLTADGR